MFLAKQSFRFLCTIINLHTKCKRNIRVLQRRGGRALAVATGSPAATATSAGRLPLRDGSAVFYLQTRRNNNNTIIILYTRYAVRREEARREPTDRVVLRRNLIRCTLYNTTIFSRSTAIYEGRLHYTRPDFETIYYHNKINISRRYLTYIFL